MASSTKDLGKKIATLRKEAALTQDELSDKAGLAYSTLAKIERGAIKNPSVFTVASLAQALNVRVEQLLEIPVPEHREFDINKAGEVKFFYCDINGVLVRFYQRAFTKLSEQTGLNIDKIETTFWHYNDASNRGEMTLSEYNKAMQIQLSLADFDWKSLYFETIERIDEMYQCLIDISKKVPVGLISNTHEGFINEMRKRDLIPDIEYAAIVDSFEVHAIKPEPNMYQLAEEAAGFSGNEILFVDDSRTNLIAAERFDWRVLWFDDYRPEESVQRVLKALEG